MKTNPAGHQPASAMTKKINQQALGLDWENEFAAAQKGLIKETERLEIKNEAGEVVWSQKAYSFLESEQAPPTVHPKLWQEARLNQKSGLFQVTDSIYQVRGFDSCHMTFVATMWGWVVIDPLKSTECAWAAYRLVSETLGKRPIKAIILSSPQIERFGGIKGILPNGGAPIIAHPKFLETLAKDNRYKSPALDLLKPCLWGDLNPVFSPSSGIPSFLAPTDMPSHEDNIRQIDGLVISFQLVGPAQLNLWFPQKKALFLNSAPLDGSNCLMELFAQCENKVQALFRPHGWPSWGNSNIREEISGAACSYKYLWDYAITSIQEGYTLDEAIHRFQWPQKLEWAWAKSPAELPLACYFKAIYAQIPPFAEKNPLDLIPLPPETAAKKLLEYMGGIDKVLDKAATDHKKGQYRWIAHLARQILLADPKNQKARSLYADSLEQLGYQSSNSFARHLLLNSAIKLRQKSQPEKTHSYPSDLLRSLDPGALFDLMSLSLDKNQAQHLDFNIAFVLVDDVSYVGIVRHGVFLHQQDLEANDAKIRFTLSKKHLFLLTSKEGFHSALLQGLVKTWGDVEAYEELLSYLKPI